MVTAKKSSAKKMTIKKNMAKSGVKRVARQTKEAPAVKKTTFVGAIKSFLRGYFDFRGVATRSEYWYVTLFLFLLSLVVGLLGNGVAFIVSAFLVFPQLALNVRRFHDAGFSAWLYFGPVLLWGVLWATVTTLSTFFINELLVLLLSLLLGALVVVLVGLLIILGFVPSKLENNKYRK